MYRLLFAFIAISIIACKAPAADESANTEENMESHEEHEGHGDEVLAKVVSSDDQGNFYGQVFEVKPTIEFDEMVSKMSQTDTLEVVVQGYVDAVCQNKGCWANFVETTETTDPSVFVKFKDYAFFLPMDCIGQELYLKGQAYKEITSVDELRHYAEDEGKSAEEIAAITEPVEEMKFMASGAYLKNKEG